ncbi:hypothetical protein DL766_003079 [Monosporascus sp. MC13-8B]|uniref:Integral membrane protein n=1 Tax=Monosporascus cannonballus TaxID=155416 RepID=A0ABY0GRA8_9PEZI|nr:hypothetical protein DL762_010152 [Monosporascus cannonballus]RYO93858.1 hypothetical protein DL763_004265 [Monosporascus cannonballus]RYP34262.1 hypothetical protein DL766_003079 [Monosporascus sp. MC13-8B]
MTTEWLFLGIALVLIIARLHLRLKIKYQPLASSDCFLITAWLASMSNACFDIAFLRMGILRPDMDVALSLVDDLEVLQQALRNFWATNFPFYTTLYMCKASILAFYQELFPVGTRLYRLWFLLDGNIGLIIACLPSLRPYIRLICDRLCHPQPTIYKHCVISGGKVALATAIPSNSGRVEDKVEVGINYVCTKVSQSARPTPSCNATHGLARYKANTGTSSRSSARGDAAGSDIELVNVNSPESRLG